MPNFAVILAAAGRSSRFGDVGGKKPFVTLGSHPVWFHSAARFSMHLEVQQIVIVVSAEDEQAFTTSNADLIQRINAEVVVGGEQRSDSIANGLAAVRHDIDFVAIHDAARPCVSDQVIEAAFAAAEHHECIVPAVPVSSTVKRSLDGGQTVSETVDRSELHLAQTPQVFSRQLLTTLFQQRETGDSLLVSTDEAQLAEHFGHTVHLVPGCPRNLKLTTADDLTIAKAFVAQQAPIHFDTPPDAPRRG